MCNDVTAWTIGEGHLPTTKIKPPGPVKHTQIPADFTSCDLKTVLNAHFRPWERGYGEPHDALDHDVHRWRSVLQACGTRCIDASPRRPDPRTHATYLDDFPQTQNLFHPPGSLEVEGNE